jgi:beta-1,4-mannosyltransferase
MRVTTVVLGDLARSPRMQYHAEALARSAADVDVVAYADEVPAAVLADRSRITIHALSSGRARTVPRALFIPYTALRVLAQAAHLMSLFLVHARKPDVILVQSPPAVPVLAVALLAARVRGARLVIDWHNFGYSMLALRLGARHPAVRLARAYERTLARRAHAHLCVSHAMKRTLAVEWGLSDVTVLHDRPHARFTPLPPEERARARRDFGVDAGAALVVSATSWTADEDFDVLREALLRYEQLAEHARTPLHVVISGRGALRERFERRLPAFTRVRVRTVWLPAGDYPRLLAAADLGLSLHRSASGVDLPMKIADMHGAGLPVAALDYGPCLAEQIHDGRDGLLFTSAGGLAQHLADLFHAFPHDTASLDRLRQGVAARGGRHWGEEWNVVARPVILA